MAYEKPWYIKLDLKKQYDNTPIVMKVDDFNVLYVQLFSDGEVFNLDQVDYASIVILRPDNTNVVGSAEIIDNGKLRCIIDPLALEIEGVCRAEIDIYSDSKQISSTEFSFNAADGLLNGDNESVTGTHEYPILIDLLSSAGAAETERSNNEEVRKTNEVNRENSFDEKIIIIDEKITAADTSTFNANNAATAANEAATAANTAANQANVAAASVNQSVTNATNAANTANEKATLANTAAQAANTATNEAINAKDQAILKSNLADQKATLADEKATLANAAAINANNARDNITNILTGINEDEETRKANEVLRVEAESSRENIFITNETNRENIFNSKVTEVNNAAAAANGALVIAQSQPIQTNVVYDTETKLLRRITYTYEGYEETFDITKRHNGLAETIIETKKIGDKIYAYQHDLSYTVFVDNGKAQAVLSKIKTTEF